MTTLPNQAVWELEAGAARLGTGALDRRPDVLVVGGDVVGLAAAALCRRAGLGQVKVVEQGRLASGPSGRGGASWHRRRWSGPTLRAWSALAARARICGGSS